jgi:pyruvate/2-oxoglutarate dehydrogenase complex dihydrolipoamide dehydrogenase (E3) component
MLSGMADNEVTDRIVDNLKRNDIQVRLNTSVTKIESDSKNGNSLLGLRLSDNSQHKADILVVSVGVKPVTGFVEKTGIEINRGIVVGMHQATNIQGIWAAGDVSINRRDDGSLDNYYPTWPNAVAQGRVAAINMLGGKAVHNKMLPMNTCKVFDMYVTTIGSSAQTDNLKSENMPSLSYLTYHSPAIYQKITFSNNVPVRYMATGDIYGAGIICAAIQGGLPSSYLENHKLKHLLPVLKCGVPSASYSLN